MDNAVLPEGRQQDVPDAAVKSAPDHDDSTLQCNKAQVVARQSGAVIQNVIKTLTEKGRKLDANTMEALWGAVYSPLMEAYGAGMEDGKGQERPKGAGKEEGEGYWKGYWAGLAVGFDNGYHVGYDEGKQADDDDEPEPGDNETQDSWNDLCEPKTFGDPPNPIDNSRAATTNFIDAFHYALEQNELIESADLCTEWIDCTDF